MWGPPEDHFAHLLRTVGAERFVYGTLSPLRLVQNPQANLDSGRSARYCDQRCTLARDSVRELSEIVQRVRDGRLRTNIGTVSALYDTVAAFNSTERRSGKRIIRVRP